VASQLKALIEQHGITLCNDPKRCRALLLDICGNYKKEIHVLVSALENGIPGELLSSQNVPFEILRNRLVKKLSGEFALADQAAGWSIDTWAFALEIQNKMPDIAGELIGKGDLLLDQGKHEEALKFFEKALEIDPRDVHVWNLKGICLGEIGKHYDAMHCYEKALSFDSQYVHAWNNKGFALNQLRRFEEALRCLDKAVEIDPQHFDAWNNKGWALYNLNRYEEALRCYDKALEIDPQNAYALKNKHLLLPKLAQR
jgi:tetratricopeptide (TPR) repeat protein